MLVLTLVLVLVAAAQVAAVVVVVVVVVVMAVVVAVVVVVDAFKAEEAMTVMDGESAVGKPVPGDLGIGYKENLILGVGARTLAKN
eukprot:6136960-Pleurochrysis_carterae.AAC.2